jgi:hypothetical protein
MAPAFARQATTDSDVLGALRLGEEEVDKLNWRLSDLAVVRTESFHGSRRNCAEQHELQACFRRARYDAIIIWIAPVEYCFAGAVAGHANDSAQLGGGEGTSDAPALAENFASALDQFDSGLGIFPCIFPFRDLRRGNILGN